MASIRINLREKQKSYRQNITQEQRDKDLRWIVRHLEGEKVSVSSCRTDL